MRQMKVALLLVTLVSVAVGKRAGAGEAGKAPAPSPPPKPLPPVPRKAQLQWQRLEMTMFLHFGVNTFTDREWGDGKEDPKIFQPAKLDCRQWVKTAKKAGFKLMILTAKHHDGFCLWPSKYTDHCVKSPGALGWRGGKGDVVKEFTDACHAEGMKVGLYLSPWDRHDNRYGTPAYNEYFKNQLGELMTQYGTVDEVWFDGARQGKGTPYDWQGFYAVIYKHNPQAVIAICGPDVRWVGNESGVARAGESSVQNAGGEIHAGKTGKIWYPAECDVSIRPGWFYHKSQDSRVKSVDKGSPPRLMAAGGPYLLDIYFKSVGRNSVLLLNVPPDRDGLLAPPDVERLGEFRAALDEIFRTNLAAGRRAKASAIRGGAKDYAPANVVDGDLETYWATDDDTTTGWVEVDLGKPVALNLIDVREAIALGERVEQYHVEAFLAGAAQAADAKPGGQWQTIARGTVIGQRNLLATPQVETDRVRLVIDKAKACPAICEFGVYLNPRAKDAGSGSLAAHKPAQASNVHPGGTEFGADKAVDDDPATRWATADDVKECWLEADLLKPQTIARVKIQEFQPRIRKFQLEYRVKKDDPWQAALGGSGAGTDYSGTFPPVEARYVRLHILDASSSPTIWELQVFEHPDPLPPAPKGRKWKMIWHDEFDGQKLDAAKWTFRPEGRRKGGWWRNDAVSLDGRGNLVIRTFKEGEGAPPRSNAAGGSEKYIDGCVITDGKFEHRFGYWVARMQVQQQPGHWSAFWLQTPGMGNVGDEGRDGTEIDIMEKPWLDDRVQHTLHWDGYGKEHKSAGKVSRTPGVMKGFHSFALLWMPKEYAFYVDGQEQWRTSAGGVSQVPQYIMISDEIGKWAGDITKANLPDQVLVDYVRVYDLVDADEAPASRPG